MLYSSFPAGVHPATLTRPVPSHVRRVGSPPTPAPKGMVYTSVGPSYCAVKARSDPSGEIRGELSSPACVVRRVATPPDAETFHRSPSATNTMVSLKMQGIR